MHTFISPRRSDGFTIVEILIVIVVIAILVTIVIVGYNGVTERARINVLQQSLTQAAKGLEVYKTSQENENYPPDLATANINSNSDNGVTFQYSVDNNASPKFFCVTAVLNGVSYYYSSTNNQALSGTCPGHSPTVYYTAAGWTTYPIPWSTGTDHGYGAYYGVYYPSTLHADNSGSLTLFNPYAQISTQSGVRVYFWCRNTSTNAIANTTAGSTFSSFTSGSEVNTITWSCPAGTVLYALNIGSTSPTSGNDPDSFSGSVKNRTWYSPQSPNHVAPQPYVAPTATADSEGWVTTPIPWGSGYSDLGYGPYYGVYFSNDPAKSLASTQTGTLQLYNPYAATRSQGGVTLYYWCKSTTTGVVRSNLSTSFATFSSGNLTKEVNWSCPAGTKLFAATIGSTSPVSPTNYYPNESTSKTRFWFSGESVSAYPSYIESVRTLYGE